MKNLIVLEPGDKPEPGDLGFDDDRGCWFTAEQRYDMLNPPARDWIDFPTDVTPLSRAQYRFEWGCAGKVYNGTVVFIRDPKKKKA